MSDTETIRDRVAGTYTRALGRTTGCCPPEADTALQIGYRAEDLTGLPVDAMTSSFGCGNPVAFSALRPGDVVVDLGSGAGIDLILAARAVGPGGRVIGVDMTDAMIERARATVAEAGYDNVEIRKGIIEDLPVASGSVDWVISNCVISLSPEKDRVFAEISRVLRPDGQMAVSDMVTEDMPEWIRQNDVLYDACLGGAISENEYVAGLERAGLVDVRVEDRVPYDASTIASYDEWESAAVGGAPPAQELRQEVAAALDGKVFSVRFSARKPGSGDE